jgi:hypothetical protein
MQNRLNQNDVTNQVNVEDPVRVRDSVLELFRTRYPEFDFTALTFAFEHFTSLFRGSYPGYLACDTLYHDMRHTLDMSLAMARMIEGHDRITGSSERIGPRRAMLGVIVALLHDSGYLKRTSESQVENGAVFTKIHVSRSADFISSYLPKLGLAAEVPSAVKMVHFTGYEVDIDEISFEDPRDRLLGCFVGTADLIGQMSDRMYLEKCREFLYQEFVLGNIASEITKEGTEIVRYASPDDLIIKTPSFYENVARTRMDNKLGGVGKYATAHFGGVNHYQEEINRNMRFLREAVQAADLLRLKRYCYSLSSKNRRASMTN